MGYSQQERRQSPRLEGQVPLKISSDDFDVVTETRNLSRSGVYCRVTKHIEPMMKLKIQLLLTYRKNNKNVTKKVSCAGVVVRTEAVPGENHFNTAIFFNDIKERDSDTITEYIQSVLALRKQPNG